MLGCFLKKYRKTGRIRLCNTLAILILAEMSGGAVSAADFLFDFHEEKSDIYRMSGEIQEGDSLKFAKLLGRTRHSGRQGFLFLNSGGGRLESRMACTGTLITRKRAKIAAIVKICFAICFII